MSLQLSERALGGSGRLADLVVHVVQVTKTILLLFRINFIRLDVEVSAHRRRSFSIYDAIWQIIFYELE